MTMIAVKDIQTGDWLDLEGDKFATMSGCPDLEPNPTFKFEYVIVTGIEQETPDCIRLDFEENGAPSIGFPPGHMVKLHMTAAEASQTQFG